MNAGPLISASSAGDVYSWLTEHAGLEPGARDEALVDGLRVRLGLDATLRLPDALDAANVSLERFVEALFAVVAPYASMMAGLAEMFERHQVKTADGAGDPLRIRFDFSELSEELSFSLEHFRETLASWRILRSRVTCWSVRALWSLHGIFTDAGGEVGRVAGPQHPFVEAWAGRRRAFWPDGLWQAAEPPPAPPPALEPDALRVAQCVSDLVTALIVRTVAEGPVRGESRTEPGDREPAPLADWAPGAVRLIDVDHLTMVLIESLWTWLDRLAEVDDSASAAAHVAATIDALVESLPTVEAPVALETLEELLSLPVWQHRFSLYSAWLLAPLEQALAAYPLRIEPVDGALCFRFRETRLGSCETTEGDYELLAEARRPAHGTPSGKGRTANVQPDYLIRPITGGNHDARLVLEAKHYKRANAKSFRDALTDYAASQPHATVVIANYGRTPPSVEGRLPAALRGRARALGDVHPGNVEQVRELVEIIRSALPAPMVAPPLGGLGFVPEVIVVDVSGSMRVALAAPAVRESLEFLASTTPTARVLAVDTVIRAEWPRVDLALAGLFDLWPDNGTELVTTLRSLDLSRVVVVTDDEGAEQIAAARLVPGLLGIADGHVLEWHTV